VTSLDEFDGSNLVVGADGVNSLVRRTFAEQFGASVMFLANQFAWFGTGQRYDTLTQTFRHTPIGDFNAHHYRYAPGRSTFIVETDEASFARSRRATRAARLHPRHLDHRCARPAGTRDRRETSNRTWHCSAGPTPHE
jgi:2-polyprenyl-6-methoxyphenol hydroxylase-like FAD-dependent oxidoreductase